LDISFDSGTLLSKKRSTVGMFSFEIEFLAIFPFLRIRQVGGDPK
jgi:hypothetical protein